MSAVEENRVKEGYVASVCAKAANLDYLVTPDNAEYDFQLFSKKDIKVFGEIKARKKRYCDWFVSEKKAEFLKSICELTRCAPWYVIYYEPEGIIYKLNLFRDYQIYRQDWMTTWDDEQQEEVSEWGQFIKLDQWQILKVPVTTNSRMTPMDWK
jgi:hypothetical protein